MEGNVVKRELAFVAMTLVLSMSLVGIAIAKEGVFDSEYAEISKKIAAEQAEKCAGAKNFLDRSACEEPIRERYVEAGVLRGTREYIQRNHATTSTEELRKLAQELESTAERARTPVFASDIDHARGELTRTQVEIELGEVERILRERAQAPFDVPNRSSR